MESRRRTLAKAFIWQALGLLTMSGVGWALTGSMAVGSGIAVMNTLIGFVTYILYERFWAGIGWGREV
ncbi:MAG: DUF2061 domain-containing protein [Rhodobacteraceae bacterium]|nr:MAG: DUF2061 domain-containing protein [Paracoccaceae bacterium]